MHGEIVYYEDVASYQNLGGVASPTHFVRVREGGMTLHVDPLALRSALDVDVFGRMLLDCWDDVVELRTRGASGGKADDATFRQQAFGDGFTAALRFCETRARRIAEFVATSEQPLASTWFVRFADAVAREIREGTHVE